VTLPALLAELRANHLALVSCRVKGDEVASFTCSPAADEGGAPLSRSEETTQPETPLALEQFIRRKEPKETRP
jgi:hypothetical protein